MPDINDPLIAGPSRSWWESGDVPTVPILDDRQLVALARQPMKFVHGDPLNGWSVRDQQPQVDLSFGGQHFLRQRLNTLEYPKGLLGDNQQYIDEVQDLISQGRGEFNAWTNSADALRQFIPFGSSRKTDLSGVLTRVDPDWSGVKEWKEWSAAHPDVAEFMTTRLDFDPEAATAGTRNRDAFMLVINMELEKASLRQQIDEYERHAGVARSWSQFIAGGAIRQLVLDSDTAKTLSLSAAAKGLTAGAQGLRGINTINALDTPLGIASKAGNVGIAAHNVLAKNLRLTSLGAMAVEGFATGALYSVADQSATDDMAHWLGQSDHEFDWREVFNTGVTGAMFGVGLWGAARTIGGIGSRLRTKPSTVRQAVQTADLHDTPIDRHGLTPEGITLQRMEEDGLVKVNRLLGDAAEERLGFLLSKEAVENAGRTIYEVGILAEQMTNLRRYGVRLSDDAIAEIMDDFLAAGPPRHTTLAGRIAAERRTAALEMARVKGQSPEWRAAQAARLTAWEQAKRSIDVVAAGPDGVLSAEMAESILTLGGLPNFRPTYLTKQALGEFIDGRIADIQKAVANADNGVALGKALHGWVPKSTAALLANTIARHVSEIDTLKAVQGKGSASRVKELRAEMRKANASLNKLYGAPPKLPKKQKVPKAPKARALDRLSPEEQQKEINRIRDQVTSNPREIADATTIISRGLNLIGYNGWVRRFLLSRTEVNSTFRSAHGAIREVSALAGNPELSSHVFAGRGGSAVNFRAADMRADRDAAPGFEIVEQWANRSDIDHEARVGLHKTVLTALNTKSLMPAGHRFEKEGNEFIQWYRRYQAENRRRGVRSASLRPTKEEKLSDIIPIVANEGAVRRGFKNAVAALSKAWSTIAQRSDNLNPMAMEALGFIEREVDVYGRHTGTFKYKDESLLTLARQKGQGKVKRLEKADLPEEQRKRYDAFVADADNFADAATTYWSLSLAEDVRATDVRQITDKVHGVTGRRAHKRMVTQRMLEEFPELKEFYETDLGVLLMEARKRYGYKTHLGEMIRTGFGINATPAQLLNALEASVTRAARGNLDEIRQVKEGFDGVHSLLAWQGGYLPDLDKSSQKLSTVAAEMGTRATFALFAPAFGVSNGVEAMTKVFFSVHSMADFAANMRSFVRALKADRGTSREMLRGTAHSLERISIVTARELQDSRPDRAVEMTTLGAATRPWRDFWSVAKGDLKPNHSINRVTDSAMAFWHALGKTNYTIGGSARFNRVNAIVSKGAAEREVGRYGPALVKLRQILRDDPGLNASTEEFVKFTQRTRQAGFGTSWDVAEQMIRAGLMDEGVTEALMKLSSEVPGKSPVQATTGDLWDVYFKMAEGPEKDMAYEALQRAAQFVDDRIARELALHTPWTVRTDARSRSALGRVMDSLSTYMHNIYAHKLGRSSQMPSRSFVGLVTTLVVAETMLALIQRYLGGHDVESMAKEWDSPEEAMFSVLSTGMRVPFFGAYSFIPKYAYDAARARVMPAFGLESPDVVRPEVYGGPVGSTINGILKVGEHALDLAIDYEGERSDRSAQAVRRFALKTFPLTNTFYGKTLVRTLTSWMNLEPDPTAQPSEGRSMWGDDTPGMPGVEQPAPAFDLEAALTQRR